MHSFPWYMSYWSQLSHAFFFVMSFTEVSTDKLGGSLTVMLSLGLRREAREMLGTWLTKGGLCDASSSFPRVLGLLPLRALSFWMVPSVCGTAVGFGKSLFVPERELDLTFWPSLNERTGSEGMPLWPCWSLADLWSSWRTSLGPLCVEALGVRGLSCDVDASVETLLLAITLRPCWKLFRKRMNLLLGSMGGFWVVSLASLLLPLPTPFLFTFAPPSFLNFCLCWLHQRFTAAWTFPTCSCSCFSSDSTCKSQKTKKRRIRNHGMLVVSGGLTQTWLDLTHQKQKHNYKQITYETMIKFLEHLRDPRTYNFKKSEKFFPSRQEIV